MASQPLNANGLVHRAMTTGKTRCLLVVLLHLALACAPARTSAPAPDATWEERTERGWSLYRRGYYVEAEKWFRAAVEQAEKFAADDPRRATSLNALGRVYEAQGKYADAEPLHKRSLAIREKALGSEHPNVTTALQNYAALLREVGRDAEADRLDARAKSIRAKQAAGNSKGVSSAP